MSLQRRSLLESLRSKLLGRTDAGQEIIIASSRRIWEEHLPAIHLYPVREDAEPYPDQYSPLAYLVTLQVAVEFTVKDFEDTADPSQAGYTVYRDELERLVEQTQDVLLTNSDLGGNAKGGKYLSAEFDEDSHGKDIIGGARIIWEYQYELPATQEGKQPNVTSDLKTVAVDIETDSTSNSTLEAEGQANIPQE